MKQERRIKTPNFDRIDPRTCINSKVRKLHRMLNAVYQSKLKPYDLQGSMLAILFIIGKQQRVSQKILAERLVLDQSTMSRDLKKLMSRGLLISEKSEADSRISELVLTNKGYQLLEEVSPIWESVHHEVESILGSYSIAQIDQIISAVQTNIGTLTE